MHFNLVAAVFLGDWVDRLASVITIVGLPSVLVALWAFLRPLIQRFSQRAIRAEPLGLDSGFKGLVCLVSAQKGEKMPADQVQALVDRSSVINDELRGSPIGSNLKALEQHRRHLEDCWFLSSTDSEPYRRALENACAKFFPTVTVHLPEPVQDVSRKIDGVYERTHQIFNSCQSETKSHIKPRDIITDVTGGTKIMSIAVAMACLDADREIQYIEQETRRDFYRIDITWEKIARRPA